MDHRTEEELNKELKRLAAKIRALEAELRICETRRSAIKNFFKLPTETFQAISNEGGQKLPFDDNASNNGKDLSLSKAELKQILEKLFERYPTRGLSSPILISMIQDMGYKFPIQNPNRWIHPVVMELIHEGSVRTVQEGSGRRPYIFQASIHQPTEVSDDALPSGESE